MQCGSSTLVGDGVDCWSLCGAGRRGAVGRMERVQGVCREGAQLCLGHLSAAITEVWMRKPGRHPGPPLVLGAPLPGFSLAAHLSTRYLSSLCRRPAVDVSPHRFVLSSNSPPPEPPLCLLLLVCRSINHKHFELSMSHTELYNSCPKFTLPLQFLRLVNVHTIP